MAVMTLGPNCMEECDNGRMSTPIESRGDQLDAAVFSNSGDDSPGIDEKAARTTTEPSIKQAPIPKAPDGGLRAWLQVLGGFVIYLNTW